MLLKEPDVEDAALNHGFDKMKKVVKSKLKNMWKEKKMFGIKLPKNTKVDKDPLFHNIKKKERLKH